MAKKEEKSGAKKSKKGASSGKNKLRFIMMAIIFSGSLLFIMPTFALVMVGMIPTIVALLTDKEEDKAPTICIGALNVVGVMPFVLDLWMKGQTLQQVWVLMTQTTTWVVILGAAGIGKLIIFAVPQATAAIAIAHVERRLKVLNENLTSLRAAWGPEVGTTKPLNSLRPGE